MTTAILDASALLALLKGEPGADIVAEVVTDAAMSVFNLAEIASHFYKLGMPPAQVDAMLRPLPIELVPADVEQAWDAASLRVPTATAGLSLGDRFCLALARRRTCPAYTADKAWASIAGAAGVKVIVIR